MSSVLQIKQSIKNWETEFTVQHSRPPTKVDVRQHPDVAQLYVQYGKLLRSLQQQSSNNQSNSQLENQSTNVLSRSPSIIQQSTSRTSSLIQPIKPSLSNTISLPPFHSNDPPAITRERKRQRIDDDEFSFQPVSRTESSFASTDNTQKLNNDDSTTSQPVKSSLLSSTIDASTIRPPQSLSKRADVMVVQAGTLSTVNRAVSQPFDVTLQKMIEAKRSETASLAAVESNKRIRDVYTQKSSTGCRVGLVDPAIIQRSLSQSSSLTTSPVTPSIVVGPVSSPSYDRHDHDNPPDLSSEDELLINRSRVKPSSTQVDDNYNSCSHSTNDQSINQSINKSTTKKRTKSLSRSSSTTAADSNETQPIKRTKKNTVVSTNFVRTDMKHKTKSYGREGGSSNAARKKAFRERRGWTNRWERAAEEKQRIASAADAAHEELVDVTQVKAALGYNSDDDRQALAAFESPPASSSNEFLGSFDDAEAYELLFQNFGHNTFREGQLDSIKFTLNHPNAASLLIQPTGHGKSLCYLLPATKLRLTLVVSPLLALMSDQCLKLPKSLPGVVWTGSCTKSEVEKIISRVRFGDARLLYVSPEKFVSASFVAFMQSLNHIDMVVIDEAHCITQWSHNFRPSYLYLKTVINSLPRRPRVLAMTATATPDTENEIALSLGIAGLQVMRHGPRVRANIKCRVKRVLEDNKDTQVVDWINEFVKMSDKRASRRGIIVYVNFREHADRLSRLLSTHGINSRSYHAGLSSAQRQAAQAKFLDNSLHVMVATIAFGLGIDKPNIGLVIHTFLPGSLSSYTQEIGRAGRDGVDSHAWLCFSDRDELNQRSWIHRQGVDEGQMRQFVRRCFSVKSECAEESDHTSTSLHAPYAQLQLDKLKQETSLEPEVAETLLAQIELAGNNADNPCLKLVGSSSLHVDITFARSWDSLRQMSTIDSPLAELVRSLMASYPQAESSVNAAVACNFKRVSIPKLANHMRAELTAVTQSLMTLRAMREVTLHWSKATALVIRLTCHHDCDTLEHAENLISIMKQSNLRAQQASTAQVDAMIAVLRACERESVDEQSNTMHDWLNQHFSLSDKDFARSIDDGEETSEELDLNQPIDEIHPLVLSLVTECTEARQNLTARSYACILHGMGSTTIRTKDWRHSQFWCKLKHLPFLNCQQQAERAMAQLREIKVNLDTQNGN